MFCIFFTCRS